MALATVRQSNKHMDKMDFSEICGATESQSISAATFIQTCFLDHMGQSRFIFFLST